MHRLTLHSLQGVYAYIGLALPQAFYVCGMEISQESNGWSTAQTNAYL